MPARQRPEPAQFLTALAHGELRLLGRMPWSSNATFLAEVGHDGVALPVVYKPGRGERPLRDFPPDLYRREQAAYLLSDALGWGLVPETVLRDGPHGRGAVQRLVPADYAVHYFTLLEQPQHRDALLAVAVFDVVANNADRKGGHVLLGDDGRIWSVDHGLCFHARPKLRTVVWDFAGQPVPEPLVADVARLAAHDDDLLAGLLEVLAPDEVDALRARAAAVVEHSVFPTPGSRHPFPWPLV